MYCAIILTVVVACVAGQRHADGPQFEAGLPLRQVGEKTVPKLWPKAKVPYSISSSIVSDSKIRAIREPMQDIEANTCIKFVNKRPSDTEYINIQTDRAACSAQIGQQTGINQLNLADSCYDYPTIALLILHSLGLCNEHNREDRDKYVEINMDNIRSLHQRKFEKLTRAQCPVLDTPYDIKSLTHFDGKAFGTKKGARDWTIRSLKTPSATLGNSRISAGDYQKLNNLYCGGSGGRGRS
ncbi:zinc metalloproteinase nas-14-like [Paramacrobiotus metropolitanus]|uniref:zinc metalloproteinase nas-14-like n=1 Tax=Paramacrobiotus metropolitanus TaxID=2943436 RepID=UPI0024465C43|nr:zinc metalloproteinase nas-14-like [Paramacrobiotus metropolitanus]